MSTPKVRKTPMETAKFATPEPEQEHVSEIEMKAPKKGPKKGSKKPATPEPEQEHVSDTEMKASKKGSKKPEKEHVSDTESDEEKKKVVRKLDFENIKSHEITEIESDTNSEPEEAEPTEKKKKSERKAPKEHAKEFEEGDKLLGLNGKMHVVRLTKKGVKRWVACN